MPDPLRAPRLLGGRASSATATAETPPCSWAHRGAVGALPAASETKATRLDAQLQLCCWDGYEEARTRFGTARLLLAIKPLTTIHLSARQSLPPVPPVAATLLFANGLRASRAKAGRPRSTPRFWAVPRRPAASSSLHGRGDK